MDIWQISLILQIIMNINLKNYIISDNLKIAEENDVFQITFFRDHSQYLYTEISNTRPYCMHSSIMDPSSVCALFLCRPNILCRGLCHSSDHSILLSKLLCIWTYMVRRPSFPLAWKHVLFCKYLCLLCTYILCEWLPNKHTTNSFKRNSFMASNISPVYITIFTLGWT